MRGEANTKTIMRAIKKPLNAVTNQISIYLNDVSVYLQSHFVHHSPFLFPISSFFFFKINRWCYINNKNSQYITDQLSIINKRLKIKKLPPTNLRRRFSCLIWWIHSITKIFGMNCDLLRIVVFGMNCEFHKYLVSTSGILFTYVSNLLFGV